MHLYIEDITLNHDYSVRDKRLNNAICGVRLFSFSEELDNMLFRSYRIYLLKIPVSYTDWS